MTSDALTRLLARQDGQAPGNGFIHHATAPDLSEEVVQLRAALVTNRRISMAMSNRKLRDVAEDVIHHRRIPPGSEGAERLTL